MEQALRDAAPGPRSAWITWMLPVTVLAILTAGAFASSLPNGFTNWDDNWLITRNPWVREATAENIETILNPRIPVKVRYQLGGEYLPVRDLSTLADMVVYKDYAPGHHLTNLLLHLAVVLLVFWAVRRAGGGAFFAFATAGIFALQPVHVESVAWLSSRKDLLAGLFSMLSLVAWMAALDARPRGRRAALFSGSFLFFVLACTSKYMAVTLPAWLLLYTWFFRPDAPARLIRRGAFFAARPISPLRGTAVFLTRRGLGRRIFAPLIALLPFWAFDLLFVKTIVVQIASKGLIRDYYGGGFFPTLLTVLKVFVEYVALLFVPYRLQACIDYPLTREVDLLSVGAAVLLAGLAGGGLWLLGKRLLRPGSVSPAQAVIGFSLAFFFTVLSPVSNVLFPMGTLFAERYLYMAVLSSALVFALVLEWMRRRTRAGSGRFAWAAPLALLLLLAGFGWRTFERNFVWEDSGTLWRDTLDQSPGKSHHTAHFNLGNFYQKQGTQQGSVSGRENFLDAKEQFSLALVTTHESYYFDYARVHAALGTVESLLGRRNQAIRHLHEALRLNRKNMDRALRASVKEGEAIARATIHLNLGDAIGKTGEPADLKEAMRHFEAAIELNPDLATAYLNLGLLRHRTARTEEEQRESLSLIRTAGLLDKYLDEVPLNLGILALNARRLDEAEKYFDQVLARNPEHVGAQMYKVTVHLNRDENLKAREILERIASNPDMPTEWVLNAKGKIGFTYEVENRLVDAEKIYLEILNNVPAGYETVIRPTRERLSGLYLALASTRMNQGRFAEAKDHFKRAIWADRKNKDIPAGAAMAALKSGEALLEKAVAAMNQGKKEEAGQLFNDAALEFQDSVRFRPTFEAYIALSECAKKLGAVDDAIANLERALSLQPRAGFVQSQLEQFYIAKGEIDRREAEKLEQEGDEDKAQRCGNRAYSWFRKAADVNLASTAALRILVSLHKKRAEALKARIRKTEAEALEAEDAGEKKEAEALARKARGLTAERKVELETQLALVEEILARRPDSIPDLSSKLRLLALLGRREEALAVCRVLIRLQPKEGNHRLNEGLLLTRLGRIREAVKALEAGLEISPDHPRLSDTLTGILLAEGLKYSVAFTHFRTKEKKASDPGEKKKLHAGVLLSARTGFWLLSYYSRREPGKWKKVYAQKTRLEKFLALEDAKAALAQRDPVKARKLLGRVLEIDGTHEDALSLLLARCEEAEDLDEKEAILLLIKKRAALGEAGLSAYAERLYVLEMKLARLRNELGLEAMKKERWQDAVREFEAALRSMPGFVPTHLRLAEAYERLGRLDQAKARYRTAVKILKAGLSRLEGAERTRVEAQLFQVRGSLNRLTASEDYEKGFAALRAKNWAEAERLLAKALEAMPDFPYAHYHRASALENLNRPGEALAAYRETVRLFKAVLPTLQGDERVLAEDALQTSEDAVERLGK